MTNDLFILDVNPSITASIIERYPFAKVLNSMQLDNETLSEILQNVFTKHFYVLKSFSDVLDYRFDYSPLPQDKENVHVWHDSDALRLLHTATVKREPHRYTDSSLKKGKIKITFHSEKVFECPVPKIKTQPDVFIISSNQQVGEAFVQKECPGVECKFIQTFYGVDEPTLQQIVDQCETYYFYVLDTNIKFDAPFDFSYIPSQHDAHYTHVWGLNKNMRLYNQEDVEQDISQYTDSAWDKGNIALKIHNDVYTVRSRKEHCDLFVNRFSDVFIIGDHELSITNQTHYTTTDALVNDILNNCNTPYFYVYKEGTVVKDFFFDFLPSEDWMDTLVWVWDGKDNIKFGNLEALKNNPLLLQQTDRYQNIENDIFERYGREWPVYTNEEGAGRDAEKYYFIKDTDVDVPADFRYDYVPSLWDADDIHVWQRVNPHTQTVYDYSGMSLHSTKSTGDIRYVKTPGAITKPYDVIMISFYEDFADESYRKLIKKAPHAKRVINVKGIFEAHKRAAEIATTPMFYVVDADAVLEENFNFSFMPRKADYHKVYVWRSKNPINDLIYGYGGVKLFPREAILNASEYKIDFTTSVSGHFVPIAEISNTTMINIDPYTAWKSAFRECVKLSSKIIHGQLDRESEQWLDAWCSIGKERKNGTYAIQGANEGKRFGAMNSRNPEQLKKINDYDWLRHRWENRDNT